MTKDPMADALAAALPARISYASRTWNALRIAEFQAARLAENGWRLVRAPGEPLLDDVRDHVAEEVGEP